MARGGNKTERLDIIDSFDPRVQGRAAAKGTLFRLIPSLGTPIMLIKSDEGFSRNWQTMLEGAQSFVYYVTPGLGITSTIQKTIDMAYAAGSGSNGKLAVIYVPPGQYVENLIFRPGQVLIAQSSNITVGAVVISGQHSYTPLPNGDLLGGLVILQGFSFIDILAGNTVSLLGTEGSFFALSGCSFIKDVTGHCVFSSNSSSVFVLEGCTSTADNSPDAFVSCASQVCVLQNCGHQSFGPSGLLDYTGAGSFILAGAGVAQSCPYIVNILGGQGSISYMNLAAYAPDADGVRVAAGAVVTVTHSTILVSGTGFVFQGLGTVNAALNVYPDGNTKDPALTFNALNTVLV